MRNYPSELNTKDDYEYVRANFPKAQWQQDWQNLLDSQYVWMPEKELKAKADGIEDDTHRVSESQDKNGKMTYTQYIRKVNPSSKLKLLGFTETEVKKALAFISGIENIMTDG